MTASPELFDVIAVIIATGEERVLDTRKTKRNAEAIMDMAVMRRGVETEFYTIKPHPYQPAKAEGAQP